MKHLARFLYLILIVGAGFFLSNCGGDGGGKKESEKEKQFNKLKGTWTVLAVETTAPGGNTEWSDKFEDGTLTLISENFEEDGSFAYTFEVDGGVSTSPWPGEGSWMFSDSNPSNNIIRLDSEHSAPNLTMTYQLLDAETLEINFQLDPGINFVIPNGKVASVEGDWTFTFTKL